MTENETEIRVKDNRLFNADGTLRDTADTPRDEKSATPPRAAQTESKPHRHGPDCSHDHTHDHGHEHHGDAGAIDFPSFILSLATSAQINLGIIPNPMTGKPEPDLHHAKQTIDIIGMLEEKTKGNLQPEESGLLKQVLFQLRMQYVELNKARG